MGTWGYRPKESDDVADAVSALMGEMGDEVAYLTVGSIPQRRAQRLKRPRTVLVGSGGLWTRVGLIEAYMGLGGSLSLRTACACRRWLQTIARDDEWLDGWSNPQTIRRSVKAYLALFNDLIAVIRDRAVHLRETKAARRFSARETGWVDWPLTKRGGAWGVSLIGELGGGGCQVAYEPCYAVIRKEILATYRALSKESSFPVASSSAKRFREGLSAREKKMAARGVVKQKWLLKKGEKRLRVRVVRVRERVKALGT